MSAWVDVNDRLPEDEQGVIGLYLGCEYHIWRFFYGLDDGEPYFAAWNYGYCPQAHPPGDGWLARPGEVTHWMPLPEPPPMRESS